MKEFSVGNITVRYSDDQMNEEILAKVSNCRKRYNIMTAILFVALLISVICMMDINSHISAVMMYCAIFLFVFFLAVLTLCEVHCNKITKDVKNFKVVNFLATCTPDGIQFVWTGKEYAFLLNKKTENTELCSLTQILGEEFSFAGDVDKNKPIKATINITDIVMLTIENEEV